VLTKLIDAAGKAQETRMKLPPKGSRIQTGKNGKWRLPVKQPCAVLLMRPPMRAVLTPGEAAQEAVRQIADKYVTRDGRLLK
jgi:hypothetical protein